jgi:hypothetical protein
MPLFPLRPSAGVDWCRLASTKGGEIVELRRLSTAIDHDLAPLGFIDRRRGLSGPAPSPNHRHEKPGPGFPSFRLAPVPSTIGKPTATKRPKRRQRPKRPGFAFPVAPYILRPVDPFSSGYAELGEVNAPKAKRNGSRVVREPCLNWRRERDCRSPAGRVHCRRQKAPAVLRGVAPQSCQLRTGGHKKTVPAFRTGRRNRLGPPWGRFFITIVFQNGWLVTDVPNGRELDYALQAFLW